MDCLQFTCTHKWPSVPHVELQEPARCNYKTGHVGVTKSMDDATTGDHWSRCRHLQRLQLPVPLHLILFRSSHSQWIFNVCTGFWIRDEGRHVVKTAESSGSASNAECWDGYNAMRWVCLYGSAGSCCVMAGCTWCGGCSHYWPSLCSGQGGGHGLCDICNARIVQQRWGGGVLSLDCTRYGTPFLRGIPLASRYGNASLGGMTLRILWRPTLLLFLTISKTSNICMTGAVWGWVLWEGIFRYRCSTIGR